LHLWTFSIHIENGKYAHACVPEMPDIWGNIPKKEKEMLRVSLKMKLKPSQGAGVRGRRRNSKSSKPDTVGWSEDCV